MASSSGRLAKNAMYLTIASILQKIISFAYYGYLAIAFNESGIGKYSFALLFTSIFGIFMDFGLNSLLTREGSKNEENLQDYFSRFFSVKIILILIALVVLFPTIYLGHLFFDKIDILDVQLVAVGALIIVLDSLIATLYAVFRALKKMHWEALGIIIYQVAIVTAGVIAIKLHLPLIFILFALLFGSSLQLIYMYVVFKLKTKIKFKFKIEKNSFKKILFMAAPFAIAGLIFRLTGSADTFMLKLMAGDNYVGWYSIAFKLTFALTVLPGAFATSYFPVISHHFKNAQEKMHEVFENGFVYMLILSLPIVGGVLVLGDNIVLSVWGPTWAASIKPLWIFMAALPFVFLNYPVGNFLNAVNKQTLNTVNMFISLVVNIIINAILIPYYTYNGAALAVLASSILLVFLGLPWVYKIAPFNLAYLFKKGIKIFFAAALMTFVLYVVQSNYPIFVLIPLGALLYFFLIIFSGALKKEDLIHLKIAIFKKG
ncbi:MAG: hypothetical protein A2319_00570 [Candidatus Kerfeldbacteria bacterium RIFOXYB2_FULL_38_14]|uniref:Uncharacterized protein n=1 Tax=Candidatus Kerfeldbacteria bacterium RIFOXYB2_FULL_38_14 TaxID=1798547 RepID=A0A1G2BBV5_9BACT|nr:MAG: hypothetical protein A2319_00570 [Candidatus Kerfeldbacteria bacterium RIFOXYB2_FULL_38_14]